MSLRSTIWGGVFSALSLSTFAFANATQPLELIHLANTTVLQAPIVQEQEKKVAEQQSLIPLSQVKPNPELELGVGPKTVAGESGLALEIGLKKTIAQKEKYSALNEVANCEVTLERLHLKQAKRDHYFAVIKAGYAYTYHQELLRFFQSRIQNLENFDTYFEQRPLVSPKINVSAQLVKGKLKEIKRQVIEADSKFFMDFNRLQELGMSGYREENAPLLQVPDLPKRSELVRITFDDVLKNDLQLQAYDIQLQKIDLQTKVLMFSYKTPTSLFAKYTMATVSDTETQLIGGITRPIKTSSPEVAVSLSKSFEKQALEAKKEARKKELLATYTYLDHEFKEAYEILHLYPDSYCEMLEKYSQTSIQYFKRDQIDILELLELENNYIQAKTAQLNAKIQLATALTELQHLGKHHE